MARLLNKPSPKSLVWKGASDKISKVDVMRINFSSPEYHPSVFIRIIPGMFLSDLPVTRANRESSGHQEAPRIPGSTVPSTSIL
jgi:hypothetical protein